MLAERPPTWTAQSIPASALPRQIIHRDLEHKNGRHRITEWRVYINRAWAIAINQTQFPSKYFWALLGVFRTYTHTHSLYIYANYMEHALHVSPSVPPSQTHATQPNMSTTHSTVRYGVDTCTHRTAFRSDGEDVPRVRAQNVCGNIGYHLLMAVKLVIRRGAL